MANTPHWKLAQLQRIAEADPLRVEYMLDSLWESHPSLLGELAIAALDQEQITVEDCARMLRLSFEEVQSRLSIFRRANACGRAAVVLSENRVAKLADGHVCVWEIVRELRRHWSLDQVASAFPSLSREEIEAALSYADENREEIEELIRRYEDILERRRSEYPYARQNAS